MSLTLRVKDFDRLLPEQDVSRVLETGSLTIGRGLENDWVLPDPERVISKQHCVIREEGGRYLLTDTSSNGVYLNAADGPVGRGNSATLEDGDRLRIAHLEFHVAVSPSTELPAGIVDTPETDVFADLPGAQPGAEDALDDLLGLAEEAEAPLASPGYREAGFASEPAAVSEAAAGQIPADDFAGAVEHTPTEQDFLQVPEGRPESTPAIPDDWDADWTESPATGEQAAAAPLPASEDPFAQSAPPVPDYEPPAPRPEPSPPPPPPVQPVAQPPSPPQAQPPQKVLEAFFRGADLGDVEIPDAETAQKLEMLGALFREVVQGLMEVLAARSSIKSEFRLSQTTIQPVENNPLKFSLGVDDAMTALLTKTGKGYLPPVRAVQEAIDDIKAHQVAVLAGMQVALSSLLARFDPEALEARIGEEKGIGTLLTGKKSRYWDEFTRLYKSIAAEAEDDFQQVFGREFGRAYEEQVRKQVRRRG